MAGSVVVGDRVQAWHIVWQAAPGHDFLSDRRLAERIRSRLLGAHHTAGRQLVEYLLMPREIHLVSRLRDGDRPSDLARSVGSVVARWVRARQPQPPSVYTGAYRAVPLSEDEVRSLIRLLAWRPVTVGRCHTPVGYPHSGLRTAMGLRPAQGFDSRPVLQLFGANVSEGRAKLRKWLAERPLEREDRQWLLRCGLEVPTCGAAPKAKGSQAVKGAGAALLVAAGGTGSIDGALALLERWVAANGAGSRSTGRSAATEVIAARRRALVACLAVDHGLCSAATVARHFGKAKATLSEQMTACRWRPADRDVLMRPLDRIVDEALGLH